MLTKFSASTIRARLLVGFVLMAWLPAVGISTGTIAVGYVNGRQQALDRLESVAALKEQQIESWMYALQSQLVFALNEEYALERARVVLDLARDNKYYHFFTKATRSRFEMFVEQSQQLEELLLIDHHGRVVLSTDLAHEGKLYTTQLFFQQGLLGPCVQLPFYLEERNTTGSPSLEQRSVIASTPIFDADKQVLGVMAGRAGTDALDKILDEQTGLGKSGKAYLVNLDHALLTGSRLSSTELGLEQKHLRDVHTLGINTAIEEQVNGSGLYDDYGGVRVIGVYRWLPKLQVALLAEQDLSEAFRAIYTTLAVNLGIALIAVLLAGGASLLITRSITTPLVNLVGVATQIAAGDMERIAKVERKDEVGALAQAFNSMTAQLRDLIDSLEQRVKERTEALQAANEAIQRRALQLETSAQLSREITSILDFDDLLGRVAELIRDAFNYYGVHIFFVDAEMNQLVLRATSGKRIPQLQRLGIGSGSLNGEAAYANKALLVNDVISDPRYLADEQLPDTRSELVVPLRVGERVLGTLDLQSSQPNAFAPDDALVLQSLGDQIAVAIENARLHQRSRELAILEERNRLARELHDSVTQSLYSLSLLTEGWRRMLKAGNGAQVENHLARAGEITAQALREMRLLVHELRPSVLEEEGLLGALHQRLEAVENRVGIATSLLAEDLIDLPLDVEEAFYRIAQEALNNALKHSQATSVAVHIRIDGARIVLDVTDNGRGFDPEAVTQGGGMGLVSMRERAEQMGGTLTIRSAPGEGTTITASAVVDGARSAGSRSSTFTPLEVNR